MTTQTRNEAAERLRAAIRSVKSQGEYVEAYVDKALAAERRATVERIVALLDTMIDHPRNEPRYRAAFVGLKVARRAILDVEAQATPSGSAR